VHPQTKQNRITLTGKVLNNAGIIAIIVFGIEKAEIVADILNETEMSKNLPAGLLNPVKGKLEWFLDKEASKLL
jgi:6-phosphogluconolactonase